MKKIISIIILTTLIVACTSEERFAKINARGDALTDEQVAQDLNFGSAFPTILRHLGHSANGTAQYSEDWGCDNFLRLTGTPLDEYGGRDMMSYYFVDYWNQNMWNQVYNNVMAPALVAKQKALAADRELFANWADLFMLIQMSRGTTYYGPMIYSEYGDQKEQFNYDTEKYLYEQFFKQLDDIQAVFKRFSGYTDGRQNELQRFDATYNGDLGKWMKLMNTLRLRFAMRIVKAAPGWAKEEGEKALNDDAGLILTNADNFNPSLLGAVHPLWTQSENWNDSRMGCGMEEVLVGYKDPRAHVWFQEVAANMRPALFPEGREDGWHFKGIAGGSYLGAKDERIPYSKHGRYWSASGAGGGFKRVLGAAEVNFILAEATLRGWTGKWLTKTTQEYYEEGIRQSWADYNVPTINGRTIDVYLNDDTSLPINYRDPRDARNNYDTKMTDPRLHTVKWRDDLTNEEKLERIMLQKWINSFGQANEMWNDHRRTGYPRLSDVAKNDSNEQWGLIARGDIIKRYCFVERERMSNEAGVAEATKKLPAGANLISTALWIHCKPGETTVSLRDNF